MDDEAREALQEQRRQQILRQKQMSRQALIDECRTAHPTWQEAELGPYAVARQQLSPNVVGTLGSIHRPWREIAASLVVPTLLMAADVDKGGLVTPELARAAEDLNDKIKATRFGGAGHAIRREAFDAYVAAVKAFLAE
jgi:pimeloyl-ACP methyl ester carboxylesterase